MRLTFVLYFKLDFDNYDLIINQMNSLYHKLKDSMLCMQLTSELLKLYYDPPKKMKQLFWLQYYS